MEATLQKIFNTGSLDAVSEKMLLDSATAHPYFAPLQFFRVLKLKLSGIEDFQAQAERAEVFFNNPLWFREQLKGWKSGKAEVVENTIQEDLSEESPEEDLETDMPPLEIKYSGAALPDMNVPAKDPAPHQAEVQKEELPIFQAYHTVDYFASLGIKISADMLQTDKFGKQLRSFTEWLRTMKRIPSAPGDKRDDPLADPRVMRFAETSLREGEVVTEAMAEVLSKQGKRDAAIGIYEKLSLLNPHKSAYFAALIDKLKAV